MHEQLDSSCLVPLFKLSTIGYEVEEDLPDQYDDESYIDGLLTDGMNDYQTGKFECDASEMFGEEVVGYSLY